MSYTVKKNTLLLPSGKEVEFEYPILQATDLGGVIVICLAVPQNRKLNENVYAVDHEGTLLWQVKPVKHVYDKSSYVGVTNTGKLVRLFNWDGMVYDVDPKTGVVANSYWGK